MNSKVVPHELQILSSDYQKFQLEEIKVDKNVIWDWYGSENMLQPYITFNFDEGNEDEKQLPEESEQWPTLVATQEVERPQCARRRLALMIDIDHSTNPFTQLTLFSNCDPTIFEVVAKRQNGKSNE